MQAFSPITFAFTVSYIHCHFWVCSAGHQQAEQIKERAKKGAIESNIVRLNEKHFAATNKIFHIAYKIAKVGRPFTDMPIDCDVQMLNGVELGRTLQSDKSCHDICQHIGNEMRSKLCRLIIESNSKFSILIDESTSIST